MLYKCNCFPISTNIYLLAFKAAMMPEASAGETWDTELGLFVGLCTLKLPDELELGVAGREELGELTTDGEYIEPLLAS